GRYDVDRAPSRDDADFGGGLGVEAAEPHRGDRLGGDPNGAHAALRRHAGVRGAAANDRLDEIGAGRAREDEAHGVAVEHESAPGAEAPEVEVAGAEEPHFLTDGEHDVERRMAEPALPAGA